MFGRGRRSCWRDCVVVVVVVVVVVSHVHAALMARSGDYDASDCPTACAFIAGNSQSASSQSPALVLMLRRGPARATAGSRRLRPVGAARRLPTPTIAPRPVRERPTRPGNGPEAGRARPRTHGSDLPPVTERARTAGNAPAPLTEARSGVRRGSARRHGRSPDARQASARCRGPFADARARCRETSRSLRGRPGRRRETSRSLRGRPGRRRAGGGSVSSGEEPGRDRDRGRDRLVCGLAVAAPGAPFHRVTFRATHRRFLAGSRAERPNLGAVQRWV